MLKLLRLELKLCLDRMECQAIFVFLFLLSIGAFFIDCYRNYGEDITRIRSAFEMIMIQSTSTNLLWSMETMILPLLASIIYADSIYVDRKSGVYTSIVTRVRCRTYIWTKAMVIGLVTFFVVFLPLLLNQLLCLLTFPPFGYDNNFAFPPYDIGVQQYDPQAPFDLLRLQHPLLYNVMFMFLMGIMAAAFALLTYGLFLLFHNKSRFTLLIAVFLIITLLNIAIEYIGFFEWRYTHIFLATSRGSQATIWVWLFALFLTASTTIMISLRRGVVGTDS